MKLLIARIKGFIRFKDLMGELVSRDLKLKYRRSVLGYLWSVLNPLFIMIIMPYVPPWKYFQLSGLSDERTGDVQLYESDDKGLDTVD